MLDKSVRYHCHCTGEYRGARYEPAKSRAWCACVLACWVYLPASVLTCLRA